MSVGKPPAISRQSVFAYSQLIVLQAFLLLITTAVSAKESSPTVEDLILISFDNSSDLEKLDYLETDGVKIKPSPDRLDSLRITSGVRERWPQLRITHPDGKVLLVANKRWDLSYYDKISVDVRNLESSPLTVYLRIDSTMLTHLQLRPNVSNRITIPPGETQTLSTKLTRSHMDAPELVGMQELPQGINDKGISPARVTTLVIFTDRAEEEKTYEISSIRAQGRYLKKPWEKVKSEDFFPFIDKYGQFKHDDWPGKVMSDNQLVAQKKKEAEAIQDNPRPKNWNRFGGWESGPTHKPTGHFYVKKVDNRWWLIDPDGKQFWSNGVAVVNADGNTIITDRENYYEWLPDTDHPLSMYLSDVKDGAVVKGFFKDKKDLQKYNFVAANLHRKYGDNWREIYPDLVHKRLSHMGINTLGLWSNLKWAAMRRTPYVDWVYYQSPRIKGGNKRSSRMPDMWHPEFRANLEKSVARLQQQKDNPWLIGIFVDNELPWGDGAEFIENILTASAEQPAKKKLQQYLIEKYKTISPLNEAWHSEFKNWEDVLDTKEIFKKRNEFREDGDEFLRMSAERYYKTVRNVIKENVPEKLYLGSRFNRDNPTPSKVAAKYCDVVSYNLYRETVDDFSIADGLDKPVIIGEFHFGADDRGVFGSGLSQAENQEERVIKYRDYIQSALSNPNIVGAHWFQYFDELSTGRVRDGENYQIGVVNITGSKYMDIQFELY